MTSQTRFHRPLLPCLLLAFSDAFVPLSVGRVSFRLNVEVEEAKETAVKTKTLGLLTFDLDDTLYPIQPVIKEANAAFARSMEQFGYPDIQPDDIDETGRIIREEISETEGPAAAAILTYTQIRTLAIRREIENIILQRKLQATADECGADVSHLTEFYVEHARKFAKTALSEAIVLAVLNAWEMERHHAAERHLYPECIEVFKQIKEENPNVIIGAVTDGRANPLFMTFTLAPFFDFCMSWEDDQGGRSKFFKELSSVEGNAELKWIYQAALDKYQELSAAQAALSQEAPQDPVWVHVGDDLAYDVGGAAQCGAQTILLELAEEYGQTARHRFDAENQPSWSTTSRAELEKRRLLNDAAQGHVDKKIAFISQLPEAIGDILKNE